MPRCTCLLGSNKAHSPLFRRKLSHYIRHSSYNAQQRTHDIAVLHLALSVPFNENIQPIAFPRQGQPLPYEQTANINGYGLAQHMFRVA